MSQGRKLEDPVREVPETVCGNKDCGLRSSCERFYDPLRREHKDIIRSSVIMLSDPIDDCFIIRNVLSGTLENQRAWSRKIGKHKRSRY